MTDLLLDTHCHLDAYDNPSSVLATATTAGVKLLAVTNTPDDYRRMLALVPRSGPARVALGIHPLRAHDVGMAGVLRFTRQVAQAPAVGEIGLDFSPAGTATRDRQLAVFDAILALPQLQDRPVSVHTRRAERVAITRLADAGVRAILHWYTGPLGPVDDALAAGMFFSVNPAMVTSVKGRALLARLPADRVLLETDGPYTRWRARPSQPADLGDVVDALAALWQTSSQHTQDQILSNQRQLPRPATP